MKILGIETSCDETAAAVVEDGRSILSSVVASQFDLHRSFGGVVPEVAARAHAERITAVIDEALNSAGCSKSSIDAVSVVNRPGLVGALLVGVAAAKGLSIAWEKPLIGVDHIVSHVYASVLAGFNVFPHVSLIVSGGHTSLYRVTDPLSITVLGQTADDAAGEAFDKVAKMLNLGFPGGPALSKLAAQAPAEARRLFCGVQRSALSPDDGPYVGVEAGGPDFSFSGLKTAVYYHLRGTSHGRGALRDLSEAERIEVAGSFQEAACTILVAKTLAACKREGIRSVAVGGGVACNGRLRELFRERAAQERPPIDVFFPPPELCTDNAAMSAGLAYHRAKSGDCDPLDLEVDPTPKRA
ncbi:MAG TPA: tRNA (adenosine(37)-N6)-threonylcarbamoyltransferase complex transferase subunit TsaD [Planctomycetota bacterium]|nr:tRNA (adenosine(37)-N6)-threonylcarbamoyltransferase complex transferase subunit TsaD [Planctomycetota bacterium]